MALWRCLTCTARYAVGLSRCPHCGGGDYEEDSVRIVKAGPSSGHPPADRVRGGGGGGKAESGQLPVDEGETFSGTVGESSEGEPPGPGPGQGSTTPPPGSPGSSADASEDPEPAAAPKPAPARAPKKADGG